jgi:ComF family protein
LPVSAIETIEHRWRNLCSQFLDVLFPPRCVGCRQVGTWLCSRCLDRIPRVKPPYCSRCGNKTAAGSLCSRCQTAPLEIDSIRSVVYFEGVLRDAIHHLKYRGHTVLAKVLGGLMATYWMQHPIPCDIVVPVPLHVSRLRERGYNQAALLAREMTQQAGLSLNEHTLIRQRATASQVELNAEERGANVHDAFRCTSDAPDGKQVLLIDDVCTTGATLQACAIALRQCGARTVRALTLARAH